MSFISNLFNFVTNSNHVSTELPEIYPFTTIKSDDFVRNDIYAIYYKILTDTLERTHGIPEEFNNFLWDNCLENESSKGLISLLVEAMYMKKELFVVFNTSLGVLRIADQVEISQIKSDYKQRGESPVGFYISFKDYKKTDMLKVYSYFEYGLLNNLHKSISISSAVQIKFSDMRKSVAAVDSQMIIGQAQAIAESLKGSKDIALDANDFVETASPNMDSMKLGLDFLNQKRSFYLGLPKSYIEGTLQEGMGDSGHGDAKAVDRGLKSYYFSIIKPIVESIFNVKPSYKANDTTNLKDALEALRTFEITGDEYLPLEDKQRIIGSLFDVED